MTALPRRIAGGAAAAALTLGVAWLSRAPYRASDVDSAMIRLAWSARPERIETCRTLSDDELARLPVHMRQRVVCTGTSARYRLTVTRDGAPLFRRVVQGSGVRHDRPIYVYQELPMRPGTHVIGVRFERVDSLPPAPEPAPESAGGNAPASGQEAGDRPPFADQRRRLASVPATLALSDTIDLRAGEVVLVTYLSAEQRLLVRSADPTATR